MPITDVFSQLPFANFKVSSDMRGNIESRDKSDELLIESEV